MALFKIFNNFDNPNHTLPTSAHKGYCYFDVSTKLFWIDIADCADLTKLQEPDNERNYRVPLNANLAAAAGLLVNENGEWSSVPEKTSDLINDSGFLTSAYFLVTLTITYDENDNITAVTANHTYAEIDAAFNAGKTVLVLTHHDILCLHKHQEPIEDSGSDHLSLPGSYSFQNVYTHAPYENTIYETVATVYSTNTWKINYKQLPIPTNTSDLNNDSGFLTTLDNVMIQGVNYVTAGQKSGSTLGAAATAEGYSTTASGEASHAEGSNTTASGNWSHAEGASTTASSSWSHAEGSSTTASGMYSHAEGSGTTASGTSSHAEGIHTTASGTYSHAEGYYTTANHKAQHVFGEYNVLDTSTATASNRGNYVEIVGKGTSDSARSNARTLDWSGNEVLAGKLTVGKAPTANMDVATKKYVDDATFSGSYNDLTNKPTIHTYTAGNGINITNDAISATNIMYVTFTPTYDENNDTYTVTNISKTFSDMYAHLQNSGELIGIDSRGVHEHFYVIAYDASIIYLSSVETTNRSGPYLYFGKRLNFYSNNTAYYEELSTSFLYALFLNGTEEIFPSFYAPTKAGTSGQVLKSNGSNSAPTWTTLTVTDQKVKQTAKSDNVNYKLLFTTSASPTSGNAAEAAYDTDITINPSTNTITATNFAGNATSATKATKLGTSSANTSAGSASVPVYFDEGVPVPVSLDDLRTDMGITNPITFWGVTTTTLTNGSTTTSLAGLSGNPQNGYVVIDGNGAQFIWGTVNNVAQWNQLGTGVAYKIIQSAVSTPTANGSTTAFIDTISQDANGVISVTKKNLDTSGTWSGSAAKLTTARSLKTKLDSTTAVTFDGSAAQDAIPVTGTLPIGNGGTGATTAKVARENLGAAPTPFVAGTQTASTNVWTGALPSNVTEYYNGLTIDYFLPYAGTSSAATLNLGGLGAKPVYVGNAATTAVTTHFPANSVLHLTYIVNSALNSGNGCWKVSAYQNSTYYYESCYISTGAGTAAKVGTLTNYALQPGYLQVAIYNANTAASALTLNINSTGAKPIYINGVASSSSNHTLPKGMYMVHYDGTKYDFRTDGHIDAYTNTIIGNSNSYGNTLPASGTTGQIFFQTSDPYYELPAGGSAGQALIKNSASDRDVTWGNVDALPTQSGNSGKFLTTNGTTASWANVTLSDYVAKTGDTMTGNLVVNNNSIESQIKAQNGAGTIYLYSQTSSTGGRGIYGYNASDTSQSMFSWPQDGTIHAGGQLYGAVWNDYAEYRQADSTEPGRCVVEKGDDTLTLSSKRIQPGAEIISDTFGFAIGQTEKAQTPIATSGRVLAYPYESLEEFKNAIGRPVCSGPNGTVSIMTDEEYQKFGYCAIGTISAVPEYETWGENNIAVNNRVWIRVR